MKVGTVWVAVVVVVDDVRVLVVWVLGIAAALPLWSQQARQFFYAWRKQ